MARDVPAFYSLFPGDELNNEILNYFKDSLLIAVYLKMAEEVAHYNADNCENLTFGEYVDAYHKCFFINPESLGETFDEEEE